MIGVGLIGYGVAAKVFHQPLIESVDGFKILGAMRRSSAESTPAFPIFHDLESLLALPSLKLIVVTTPNESHFEFAQSCLEAGVGVVIDKPMTVTAQEAEKLIAVAQERRQLLTVFHNRRFDGDFLTIQRLLQDQTIGRLVSFESTFDRFRPDLRPAAWREQAQPGAGILYDLGPHLIDQALLLFGWPRSVYAEVRTERDGGLVDDAFDLHLTYEDPSVLLRASMLAPAPRPRFLLRGTRGAYVKHDVDEQERLLKSGVRPLDHEWNKSMNQPGSLVLREGSEVVTRQISTPLGDYRRFYVNLRAVIANQAQLEIPPRAGLESVQIIEAALRSSATGSVVKLRTD